MTGRPSDRIPEVAEGLSPADLLAIAELALATNTAFLSTEDLEERARIGFSPPEDRNHAKAADNGRLLDNRHRQRAYPGAPPKRSFRPRTMLTDAEIKTAGYRALVEGLGRRRGREVHRASSGETLTTQWHRTLGRTRPWKRSSRAAVEEPGLTLR